MSPARPATEPRERAAPGPMALRTRRRWRRLVGPVRRWRDARRIRPSRRDSTGRRTKWHHRWPATAALALAVAGAVLFLLWLIRAAYVVFWAQKPVDAPPGFNPDTGCQGLGASCGALTGFVVSWLSVAAASVIFLFLRLQVVVRPYKRRARTKPSELVPTAGSIVGDVVGRDELCDVIIDDLRNSDDRRPHILLGGVGTGKTAVIVRLTHLLATNGWIPVPVRLRDAQKGDLDFQELARKQFRAEVENSLISAGEGDKVWRRLRTTDRIVILADGMEEALSGEDAGKDRDNLIRSAIRRARRDRLPLVITSRPHDTLRGAAAAIFELEPLSRDASLEYLHRRDATGDRQRLDWIVETADIAEAPLYLRITRELHDRGLLQHLTDGAKARGVNTRSLDRAALRLNLLDTWLWALLNGHLHSDIPLTRDERRVTVAFVSAIAVIGLLNDSLEVKYEDVIDAGKTDDTDSTTASRTVTEALLRQVSAIADAARMRSVDIRLATTWAHRLGLLEARGEEVRFSHSILQAYLGSLLLDQVIDSGAYRDEAFAAAKQRPGRELLIALVLMSRRRGGPDVGAGGLSSNNPLTDADAVSAETMHGVVTLLVGAACHRQENKSLDMLAAALEIDSVNPRPQHADVASTLSTRWNHFAASDQRTLEEAKLGLVHRFGEAVRQMEREKTRAQQAPGGEFVEPAYRDLFEIGCTESASYAVRHAVAQELGLGGHGAFHALEEQFREVLKDASPTIPDGEEKWRRRILCAWLAPLLYGSIDASAQGEGASAQGEGKDQGQENLRQWVRRVGRPDIDDAERRLPISLEMALAQGFTYAANRRRRHPYAEVEGRSFLVEQAAELLKRSGYWAAQLSLLHALTLWALPDDGPSAVQDRERRKGGERGGGDRPPDHRGPDPGTRMDHWLHSAGTRRDRRSEPDGGSSSDRKHPFVRATARLAVLALQSGQPERYIWIDLFGVTSKIGSRSTERDGARKHNLWIPPSIGWSALAPEAQQLVADVLLLINLADRGQRSLEREQRLERSNRRDLPPCLTEDREPLDPNRAVAGAGNSQPGANCSGGCPFELCPYPPKGIQSYRAELSEAFCRRQQTLLGRGLRPQSAPWQGALPHKSLKKFWRDMAHRARR
jgi:hypothetical protein